VIFASSSGNRRDIDCYPARQLMRSNSSVWIGILVGSTIGGFLPELWGGSAFSYTSVLLSGVGVLLGLWVGARGL
jgi:predicted MFS family arabinose efflux permease